ncbi:MAG: RsmE family RNA methyltransferase [Kiritimatiellae bacterium]|nr:RsmE family RNA methyltransferase [Kiritimatiellia bacterium]
MNWLIIEPAEVDADGRARLTDERAVHVRRLLRSRPSAVFRAAMLGGGRGWARVETVDEREVVVCCQFGEPPLPRTGVSVLLAMPRPKAAKRLWAQLAELGVERVWVTGSAGVEPAYLQSHAVTAAVIRRRLLDGLAQSGQTVAPVVQVCARLEDALREVTAAAEVEEERWVVDPSFSEPLRGVGGRPAVIAVGPERGWAPEELLQLGSAGFRGAHLGPRLLRTETACLVAIGRLGGDRAWSRCAPAIDGADPGQSDSRSA